MSNVTPAVELVAEFSEPEAAPTPWEDVVDVLVRAEMFWISTVRRDGRPHVTPLPAMWSGGELHFCTGPGEQKTKNLAGNNNCVLTTGTQEFAWGLDVVVEGRTSRVLDLDRLAHLAAMWRSKLDWPFEVIDGGFRDPGVAGRFAHVYAVEPVKILAFGKGSPYSQTRYTF